MLTIIDKVLGYCNIVAAGVQEDQEQGGNINQPIAIPLIFPIQNCTHLCELNDMKK